MKKEIIIPTEWSDITLNEFIKISKLDIEQYSDPIKYYIDILKIFGNESVEEFIELIEEKDLINLTKHLDFLNKTPNKIDINKVNIDKTEYKLININEINLGEYISIETLIEKDKLNSLEAIPTILSIILRPENEEFNVNIINERIELFKEKLSIIDGFSLSEHFYKWREVILYNFSALFNSKEDDEDDDKLDGPPVPEFSPRWKWFSIVERLADGDITKFDKVYKTTYISALNLLSYWKERSDYEERIRRRNELMRQHR